MIHSFNIDVAKNYGVTEAILIYHFNDDLYRTANNVNLIDGMEWIRCSVSELKKELPYLTEHKIKRALSNLVNNGVLITDNFNKSKYDRTKWYSIIGLNED